MTNTTHEATTDTVIEESSLSEQAVVSPEVERMRATYLANDAKGQATIRKGIQGMIETARLMGDTDTAERYAAIVADLIESANEVNTDLEAAVRFVTFTKVLADMEGNLSDRARTLIEGGHAKVDERLVARIAGLNVTRTAKSDDNAKRAGSNEAKGSIKEVLVAFFAEHGQDEWFTDTEIAKWANQNAPGLGYTADYTCSTGAIRARGAGQADGTDKGWANEHRLVFGPGAQGGKYGTVMQASE